MKKNMIWIRVFFISLILFNLLVIIFDFINQPNSKAVILSSLILITLTLPMTLYVIIKKSKNLAWNSFIISLFLLIINAVFYFKFYEHPSVKTWQIIDKQNLKNIEFLENSPYVKFKGNSVISSQGARGDDFTYSWRTDSLGYKNSQSIIDDFKVDYIALGNSFTESMGTGVEDTWANQANIISGIEIYNAGVQGYSGTQLVGTYNLIRKKIEHTGVIIGVIPLMFEREKKFINSNLIEKQEGTGGIASIVTNSKRTNHSFLVGFFRAFKKRMSKDLLFDKNNYKSKYSSEIPKNIFSKEELANNDSWNRFADQLKKLSSDILNQNKRVIIVMFPKRYEVYFSAKEIGVENANLTQYYIELEMLKKSMPQNVEFVDVFPYLKKEFQKNEKFFYFQKDGHLNELGNFLIAKLITAYLGKS